ncbi:MAG: hypothetical protein KJP00_08080 [Bacteroidia bacterium]|nr:hypothetical protein [Bacteroidia bacterium]
MIRILSLCLFAFLLLVGCEPGVVFKSPVPPEIESLNKIDDPFVGTFMCASDSTMIYVTQDGLFEEHYFRFVTTVDQINEAEGCAIVGRGLVLPEQEQCVPFEYIDSTHIAAKIYELDTLFYFRDYEVAKEYKGHLFLNHKTLQGTWIAWMLTPQSNGNMLLRLIDLENDIEQVEEVTHQYDTRMTRDEEIQYIINPTLVEFEKILEPERNMECETLIRMNPLQLIFNM